MPPLEISEKSIIVGPTKNIKRIGSLYKVFGVQNIILPLYMKTKRRLYENNKNKISKWVSIFRNK